MTEQQIVEYDGIEPYDNDPTLPSIFIVDIDGTLALKHPDRDIYDYSKVHMDLPNLPVIKVVRAVRQMDGKVVLMSGRSDECRQQTKRWIEDHVGYGIPMFMRRQGDFRKDYIVKHELFQNHIAGRFHVTGVFDDRDQVIRLWRNHLMIPTFQVADGDF